MKEDYDVEVYDGHDKESIEERVKYRLHMAGKRKIEFHFGFSQRVYGGRSDSVSSREQYSLLSIIHP